MRLIDADSIDYEDYWYNKDFSAIECQKARQLINEQPTVEAITIPDNATNGNMIKAMFDIKDNQIVIDGNVIHVYANGWWLHLDYKEWWNAPYKGVENGSN